MTRGTFRPSIETWQDYIGDQGFPSFPDLNLLAEGDSWFTISGLPAYNLLFELRFRKQTRIVSCGMPGDTIKHMSEIVSNRQLRAALAPGERRWDAILFSGGGNDLIDAADMILLPKARRTAHPQGPRDYCDGPLLELGCFLLSHRCPVSRANPRSSCGPVRRRRGPPGRRSPRRA